MKNKYELKEDFHWWITCIPDNIDELAFLIPKELHGTLDYSVKSLIDVSNFLIKSETVESIMKKPNLWNGLASYVGVVYEKNVPSAKWRVELDDENNLYYGVPALRTNQMTNFCPLYEITTMLDRKRPDFLYAIIRNHIELQNKTSL